MNLLSWVLILGLLHAVKPSIYTLQRKEALLEVTKDGSEFTDAHGDLTTEGGVTSTGAVIKYFAKPKAVSASSVSFLASVLTIHNVSEEAVLVHQLSPKLADDGVIYRMDFLETLPYVSFFGNGSSGVWTCAVSLPATPSVTIACTDGPSLFNASFNSTTTGPSYLELTDTTMESALLSLCAAHLESVLDTSLAVQHLVSHNEDRREKNELFVGWLWFFLFTCLFCILLHAAAWVTWLYAPCPPNIFLGPFSLYSLVLTGLLLLLLFVSGIFAFTIVFIILFLFILVCYLLRVGMGHICCPERPERKVVPRQRESESSEDEAIPAPHSTEVEMQVKGSDTVPQESSSIEANTDVFYQYPTWGGEKYGKCPRPPSFGQKQVLQSTVIAFFVSMIAFIMMFFLWSIDDYLVFDRATNAIEVEIQPEFVAKGVVSVYAVDEAATVVNMNDPFFELVTEYCESRYRRKLYSESQKRREILEAFIEEYDIQMDWFVRPSYVDYSSVNDWFTREIRQELRPVAEPDNELAVVACADARYMVFNSVPPDQRVWIKGSDFGVDELLGGRVGEAAGVTLADFHHGSMYIARLAPQDYHRFHAPVSGRVFALYWLRGTLHSVNADAMQSKNEAIFNQRMVTMLNTTRFGQVAVIAVGATCVGSVKMLVEKGDEVTRGDTIGYFQFGGSTVVVLFEKPPATRQFSVSFDADILEHSKLAVETKMNANTRCAQIEDQ